MAKKIDGYSYDEEWDFYDSNTLYKFHVGTEEEPSEKSATMVIHEGPHERVFTESEVRVMMDDVKAIAAEHSAKCYTSRIEQMTPPAPVAFHIDNYLWKKHGIVYPREHQE